MLDEAKIDLDSSTRKEVLHRIYNDLLRKPHLVAPVFLVVAVIIILLFNGLSGWSSFIETTHIRIFQVIQKGFPIVILALGVGLVIATGEIDLSVAAIAAFGGVIYAIFREYYCFNEALSEFLAVLSGGIVGWANGFLVSYRNAPSLIVTWIFSIWLTVAALLMARAVSSDGYGSSVSLTIKPTETIFGVTVGTSYFIFIVIMVVALLARLRITQQAKAVGADSQSSAYIGVRASRVKNAVFVISGVLGAIAGIMYAHSFGAARSVEIQDKSLVVVAICVLAGTLLSGGYFSPFAIVCSGVLWSILELYVPALRIPWLSGQAESHAIRVIFGFILVLAVLTAAKQLRGHMRSVLTVRTINE